MPAPSALLLGASWWTHLPKPYVPEQKERHNVKQVEQIFAPSMKVKMTHGGESGQGKEDKEDKEAFFEWLSHDGDVFNEDIASAQTLPIAGRVVGKDLYISDVKEDHGDKMEKEKQTARALISVISPGLGSEKDRTIGNFLSRPVKIISKPSKKAQNSKKGNR